MYTSMGKRLLSLFLLLTLLCCEAATALAAAPLVDTPAAQSQADAAEPVILPTAWMRDLPDELSIAQINIPGTHDSASDRRPFGSGKCQYHNVKEQLNFGVRFLDIRVGVQHDGFWLGTWWKKPTRYWLEIFHGDYRAYYYLDTILDWCRDFLKANPSETLVVCFKEDPDTPSYFEKKTAELMYETIQKYSDVFYTDGSHIPTLNEVRGKLVMMRRYSASGAQAVGINVASGWPGDSYNYWEIPGTDPRYNMYVQDCYSFGATGWDKKWGVFKRGANEIIDHVRKGHNAYFINHASGYSWPYVVENFADYVNPRVQSYYERLKYSGLVRGYVPMDCIRDKHAKSIYLSNYFVKNVTLRLNLNERPYTGASDLRAYDPDSGRFFTVKETGGGTYRCEAPTAAQLNTTRVWVLLNGGLIGEIPLQGMHTSKTYDLYTVSYQARADETGEFPVDNEFYQAGDSVDVPDSAPINKGGPGSDYYLLGFSTDPEAAKPMSSFKLDKDHRTLYAVWVKGISTPIDIGESIVKGLWLRESNGVRQYSTNGVSWGSYPEGVGLIRLEGTRDDFRIYTVSGTHYLRFEGVTANATRETYESAAQSDGLLEQRAKAGSDGSLAAQTPPEPVGAGILYIENDASLELYLAEDSRNTLAIANMNSPLHAAIQVEGALTLHAASSDGQVGVLDAAATNGGAGLSLGERHDAVLRLAAGRLNATGSGSSAAIGTSGLYTGAQRGTIYIEGGTLNAQCGSGAYSIGGAQGDTIDIVITGGSVTAGSKGVQSPENEAGAPLYPALRQGLGADTEQILGAFLPAYYNVDDVYSSAAGTLTFYVPEGLSQFFDPLNGKYYFVMATQAGPNVYREAKLTVDPFNRYIYANGEAVTIEAQGDKTRIKTADGIYQALPSIEGDPDAGYALGGYALFGGSSAGDTASADITMNGGSLYALYGGGNGTKVTGDARISLNGGSLDCLFAGGIAQSAIEGNATVALAGGGVSTGVYAGYDGKQSFGGPVAITVSGDPDLTDAVIGGVYHSTAAALSPANIGLNIVFNACGTNAEPLRLSDIAMEGLNGVRSVTLANAHVALSGIDPLYNVAALSLPGGSSLELINIAASVPELESFQGGGVFTLADGLYVQAGSVTGQTTIVPSADCAKDALVFAASDSTPATAFQVYDPLRIAKLSDGSFILTSFDPNVRGNTLYANGTNILIKAGAAAGRSLICYRDDPNTPIELNGVSGNSTDGYDLSNVTIFGGSYGGAGGAGVYGDAAITMTGGNVHTLYAGGNASTGDSGVISISGGSVSTVYAGGKDGDRMNGHSGVAITGGTVQSLYVGGHGAAVGKAADATDGSVSARAHSSGGSINSIHVGDALASGTLTGAALLELTVDDAGSIPLTPSIRGAYGTNKREVVFNGWADSHFNSTLCPALNALDAVRMQNGSNAQVESSEKFKDVGLLEVSGGSNLTVACNDLTVGAFVGVEIGMFGCITYSAPKESLSVMGEVRGQTMLTPAQGARVGDVVLRAPHAAVSNFLLTDDSFSLAKKGDTLILSGRGSDTPAAAPDYTAPIFRLLLGGGRWLHGSKAPLSFTISGSMSHLRFAEVDGARLAEKHYTIEGNTIALNAAYLNGLSMGMHTLRLVFTDGESSLSFEVYGLVAAIPATGGGSYTGVCLLLFALCLAALNVQSKKMRGRPNKRTAARINKWLLN